MQKLHLSARNEMLNIHWIWDIALLHRVQCWVEIHIVDVHDLLLLL